MSNNLDLPLPFFSGSAVRYFLAVYLVLSQVATFSVLVLIIHFAKPTALTPAAYVFIFWMVALMLNTTAGTIITNITNAYLHKQLLDRLAPAPQKVVIETRQGELSKE